jgi:ABC-2 type transport system ATP-binding protein
VTTVPAPPHQPPDQPLVSASDVTMDFGEHRALDGVTLDIERGTIVGIIGPSGCGKTTLVRILLGITAPTAGRVDVFGRPSVALTAADRNRMAYMPQLPVLFPNLSVAANLSFVASLYGVRLRGRRRRANDLLDFVDLREHRHKALRDCSGGMQRRLSLAATLVHSPELLFLDEPTAGVDPILRERFWERFRELRNEGHTIVVPTQYVGEAASCDRVAIISDGRLIAHRTPDELRREAFDGVLLQVVPEAGWVSSATMARIGEPDFVRSVRRLDDDLLVVLRDAAAVDPLTRHLQALGSPAHSIEPVEPSFDQIFVELIERDRAARTPDDDRVDA